MLVTEQGRARVLDLGGGVGIPQATFDGACRMHRQLWPRGQFFAVRGSSREGDLALLLGTTHSEINAVIAWALSGVLFGHLASRA